MNKRIRKRLILLLMWYLPFLFYGQITPFETPHRGFTSWMPAPVWEDGLLSGNGTMGAIVMGRPHDETIVFNHALSYLPLRKTVNVINQASMLTEIRQLLREGRYSEAAQVPVDQSIKDGYDGMQWVDPYVPVFNLKLRMDPGNVKDYRRMVDYETGETKVEWVQDGIRFQRSLFVSRTDRVAVLRIVSTGKINCEVQFDRHPVAWEQKDYIQSTIKSAIASAIDNWLSYRTEYVHENVGFPVGFEGVGKVIATGGVVTSDGRSITITGAEEVGIVVAVEPISQWPSPITKMKSHIDSLNVSYSSLREKHSKVHGEIYNRVKLSLGDEECTLDSEPFVQKIRMNPTPSMVVREFDAARYNILSSTGTHPPNLQGIWSGTWSPAWSSAFTHDGNVEVAVSSNLCANMPELMLSYVNYHLNRMDDYRENARRLFGCRGIVLPAHSTMHGKTIHFDKTWCLSLWTGGGGWAAGIMYDYYLYMGDLEFLRKMAYPFMKEVALFYEDFLIEGSDGFYMFTPSYSPENNPGNTSSQACVNATMDVMIARELLRNCMEAGSLLGEQKSQIHKWQDILKKLPPYQVNSEGALKEWLGSDMDENYHHRHVSHLYALYDRMAPEFKNDTSLMNAARIAVEKRMVYRRQEEGGEMVFGLAQMGMISANLGDRSTTGDIIDWMSRYYWAPSFATYHNPGHLFNMDLSGGFPSVVIRSLVYSEPGFVSLLPACPRKWTHGAIQGIRLRGQLVMQNLEWDNQNIRVTLLAEKDQIVKMKCPSIIATVNGRKVEAMCHSVSLKKGVPVSLHLRL